MSQYIRLHILIQAIGYTLSIQWLGLYKWDATDQLTAASTKEVLTRRQLRMLDKNPELTDIIVHTAASVVSECQSTFNNSRWNCSSVTELPTMSPELTTGTREQAYVYALAASMVVTSIAKACSKDSLTICPCRPPHYTAPSNEADANRLFQSSGCSVNLKVGLKISEKFTDSTYKKYKKMITRGKKLPDTKAAKEAVMNIHNSKIGRQEVKNALVIKCKCHGMSGSCELKTCWNDLDPSKIHNDLLLMYQQARPALKVSQLSMKSSLPTHNKRETTKSLAKLLNVGGVLYDTSSTNAFVFYSSSSDYCNHDARRGSHGTSGRKCGDEYSNACDTMCCGRGYTTVIHTKIDNRCNCKHIWCCHVECDVCKVDVTEYYCK